MYRMATPDRPKNLSGVIICLLRSKSVKRDFSDKNISPLPWLFVLLLVNEVVVGIDLCNDGVVHIAAARLYIKFSS